MILDQELDQLTRPEAGVIGAIGFLALGGALGNAPAGVSAAGKPIAAMSGGDLTALLLLVGCAVAAVICLAVFWLSRRRIEDLPAKIRARGKVDLTPPA